MGMIPRKKKKKKEKSKVKKKTNLKEFSGKR
jgi:hypothetical protein